MVTLYRIADALLAPRAPDAAVQPRFVMLWRAGNPPDSVVLTNTGGKGTYAFLSARVAADAQSNGVPGWNAIAARIRPQTARCCWIGDVEGKWPPIEVNAAGLVTNRSTFAISSHLRVGVLEGTRFSIAADGTGLLIDANAVDDGLTLRATQIGSDNDEPTWIPLTGSVKLAVGQAGAGDETGQFQFSLDANDSVLADLNLDLRYFKANNRSITGIRVGAVKFPIFALADTPAILKGALDPLGDSSKPETLGWFRLGHRDGVSPLPTNFLTAHGHSVHLRAHPAEAKIVFSHTVEGLDKSGANATSKSLSLTPTGPHEMWVPGDPGVGEHFLVAGNRGTELLPFVPGAGNDQIDFAHAKPAFHNRSLVEVKAQPADIGLDLTLSGLGETAWIAVKRTANAGMDFISQSQDAPLRKPLSPALLAFAGRDHAWKIPAATDRPHVPAAPLGALAGYDERYAEAAKIEADAIAPHRVATMRRKRMQVAPPVPAAGFAAAAGTTTTTTPQGFVVDVDAAGNWQKVTIALSEIEKQRSTLTLTRPKGAQRWAIEEALQQRSVLLVVTRIPAVSPHPDLAVGQADLSIGVCNWTFAFQIGGWETEQKPPEAKQGGDAPILIIKFSDRPIAAADQVDTKRPPLAVDLKSWAMPESFNDGVTEAQTLLQTRIKRILDAAKGSDEKASAFQALSRRLTDPDWNGVMMLGPRMAAPPDEIAAIQVGFAKGFTLQAECIGFDANKIDVTAPAPGAAVAPPVISLRNSAVFGVVAYPLDGKTPSAPGWSNGDLGIAFQVTRLLLQIENSAVARFACDARLRLPSFLGGVAAEGDADAAKAMIELHGKYEKRDGGNVFLLSSDLSTKDQPLEPIVFKGAGSVVPALKQMRVTRIQLACSLVASEPKKFDCTFSIAGKLDFHPFPEGFPAIAITGLSFNDARVTLSFGIKEGDVVDTKFDVAFGPLRLSVDSDANLGSGLLKQLPFRLSGFHFSGFNPIGKLPQLDVGRLGMVPFGFDKFGAVQSNFDFGLEFSLDLGAFGGLVSAARKLSASVVIGWPDFRRPNLPNLPLALGFRLDGGGGALDLGVQGILKITATSAQAKAVKDGIAIKLTKCHVDVLGHKFPDPNSELDFFLFVPAKAPDRPAWFGAFVGNATVGPFSLHHLSLAQRLNLFAAGVNSTKDAIERIEKIGKVEDPAELVGKQVTYAPDVGWTFGLSAEFKNVVGVDAVLADTIPVYGLRVSLPPDGKTFMIDALYTRIGDDIGVFSAEISPPENFRQLFLGPVELTVGNLGLQAFSNGSWTFDLCFPRGLDFSRSMVAQVFPFIGFGGLYVASRDSRTSTLLAGKGCDPTFEIGLALRVGLGRQIQKGPLSAGASITVFGIIEGAIGIDDHRKVHYRLIGRVGAIAEVYGYVDFGIVRCAVSVRVFVQLTVDLKPGEPIPLSIDAGVSVRVSVVIGRIRVWRATIEIRISFSFETQLHFEWTLDVRPPSFAALAAAPVTLAWAPTTVFAARKPLALTLALDSSVRFAAAAQAEAVMVALLSATDQAAPLADVLEGLLRWMLKILGIETVGHDDAIVSADIIERMWAGVNTNESLNRQPNPLAMPAITEFFKRNFDVQINVPSAAVVGETPRLEAGVLVPMIPGLVLSLVTAAGTVQTIDFADVKASGATVCDGTYEEHLKQWFARQSALLADPPAPSMFAAADDARTASTIVFEDWLGHLVKLVAADVQEAVRLIARDRPQQPRPTVAELIKAVRAKCQHTTGLAGRVLAHGLRAPTSAAANAPTKALYELTRQQFQAAPASLGDAADYTVKASAAPGVDWFVVNTPAADAPIDVAAAKSLATAAATLGAPQLGVTQDDPIDLEAVVSTASDPIRAVISGQRRTIWTLPPDLLARVKPGDAPSDVQLSMSAPDKANGKALSVPGPLQWATKIDFGLRQVFAVNASGERVVVSGAYQVVGANRANRVTIEALLAMEGDKAGQLLVRRGVQAVVEALNVGDAILVKTNFSTEPMPPATFAAAEATEPASADVTGDLKAFLRLLWECSIVNGTGFWLRYVSSAGNLDHLFKPNGDGVLPTNVTISLLVGHRDFAVESLRPHVNALIGGATDEAITHISITQPKSLAVHTAVQPGDVVVRVKRDNPDPTNGTDALAALSARFSLMVCSAPELPDMFDKLEVESSVPIAPNSDNPMAPAAAIVASDAPHTEGDAPVWFYRAVVPYWRLARANHLPGTNTLLPEDDLDPYIGVGRKNLPLTLGWRDLYGNALAGGESHTNMLGLAYCDFLKAPSEWPWLSMTWQPADLAGSIGLELHFAGLTNPKNEEAKRYNIEIGSYYRRLFHQLKQPDVTANVVVGGVSSSIRTQLLAFIAKIRLDAKGLIQPQTLQLQLPANFAAAGKTIPVPASVKLEIKRDKNLVTSVARETAGVVQRVSAADLDERLWLTSADIAPKVSAEGAADKGNLAAWIKFAHAFERCFPALRFLKPLDTSATNTSAAYFAAKTLIEPKAKPKAAATAFAPTPLSRALASGNVQVPCGDLAPGDALPEACPRVQVADVDLDALAARYLAAIEQTLSAVGSLNLRRADPNAFNVIAAAKQAIAQSFANRLSPIIAGAADDGLLQEAKVAMRNRMRTDLAAAYRVGAVVSFACESYGNDVGGFARLLGRPSIQDKTGVRVDGVKILPAKIDRRAETPSKKPALTFIVEWEVDADHFDTAATAPSAEGVLTFAPDFVEQPMRPNETGDEYIPSDWFQPLTEVKPASFGNVNVPLPLRRFPTRPKLVLQSAVQDFETGRSGRTPPAPTSMAERVRAARVWHYGMDITHDLAPERDVLHLVARYEDVAELAFAGAGPRTVLDALVSFDTSWSTLAPRLAQLAATPVHETVAGFAADARRLAWLCKDLADALAREPLLGAALAAADAQIDTGTIIQKADGALVADLTTEQPVAHELVAFVPGFTPWATFTPAQPKPIKGWEVTAKPPATAPTRGIRKMRAILSRLDVLTQQSAISRFQVERNAKLAGQVIAKEFVYCTDVTSFPNPLVPRLLDEKRLNLVDQTSPKAKPLQDYLKGLLTPLLQGARSEVAISIAASLATPMGACAKNEPSGPAWAIHPLSAIPATPVAESGAAIARVLADDIVASLSQRKPAIRPGIVKPEVRFQVTVFGGQGGTQVPLLTLSNVFIEADAFT